MSLLKRFLIIIAFINAPYVTTYTHENTYKHELAICAIFQNEPRLQEWIEFYLLTGATKLYLYNNNSTDNYKEILQPYIASGVVDLVEWPNPMNAKNGFAGQMSAYNHCLNKVRGHVKWLAVLDLDEFLFSKQHDDLRVMLKEYEEYGAVCANWVMFGTSDIESIPENKLMIESLIMTASSPDRVIKSIIQPDKVKRFNIHIAGQFYPGYFQVTADKVPFETRFSPSIAVDKLQINHYWPRERKFFNTIKMPRIYARCQKFSRKEQTKKITETLRWIENMNVKKDLSIQRFVEPLRQRIKQANK